MNPIFILLLGALAVISLLLLWRDGLLPKTRHIIIAAAIIFAAFAIRAVFLPHETLDYKNFLSVWVKRIQAGGGFPALKNDLGINYNLPYVYLLALISYINTEPLYPIKLVSIAFDVLLAWSAMKTVGVLGCGRGKRLFAFLGVLLLPTVVLNGAYWGQCDSVYASLALLSIYFALNNRPALSVASITLSFAFKLQAIFILPVFAAFLFCKRIKIRHLPIFPAVYLLTALPAVLAGRPLRAVLTTYFSQAGTVGDALNYNSPSIFSMLSAPGFEDTLSKLGIAFAFIFLGGLLIYVFFHRKRVSGLAALSCALLMAIGIPFLLPHMHDRYFFCADVISLVFAAVIPRYLPVPVFCSFASLICYDAYLGGSYRQIAPSVYLLPSWGAAALIGAVVLVFICMASRLSRSSGKL